MRVLTHADRCLAYNNCVFVARGHKKKPPAYFWYCSCGRCDIKMLLGVFITQRVNDVFLLDFCCGIQHR